MLITLQFVSEFMYRHFTKVTPSKGGTHFLARCVLCGDSKKSKAKKRFNLDYNNGQPYYHCFNCGKSGSFATLFSEVKGISVAEALRNLNKFDPDQIKKNLSWQKSIKPIINETKDTHNYILKDCIGRNDRPDGILQTEYKKALLNFITERKIPTSFPVFIAHQGDYKGRIILPIYHNKDIIYFQARSLEPNPDKKYKNPPLPKTQIIYNADKFHRDKYIIITEGILDAIQIPIQGTPALGVEISDDFVNALLKMTDKGVIIVIDNDTPGRIALLKFINEKKTSHLIKYFIWPKEYKNIKDLNELAVKYNIQDIYKFVINNLYTKFDTQVKLKM